MFIGNLQQVRRATTGSDGTGEDAPSLLPALDFRLVSVECDPDDVAVPDAGVGSASGGNISAGSACQKVLWPCLYFPSVEDMVSSLVEFDIIAAEDVKLLKKECARLRIRLLSGRGTKSGMSIAYLLGEDRAAHPGARERAALGVNQPIVFPDEEPLDWVQPYIRFDEEHRARHGFREAFHVALDEALRMEQAVLAKDGPSRMSSSVRPSVWKSKLTSSDDASRQGAKTPRPDSRAAAAMVTDARPNVAAGFRAADNLCMTVQPQAHTFTPAVAGGATLERQNVIIPNPGSLVMSPCAMLGASAGPENRPAAGAVTAAATAEVLTPASVAAENDAGNGMKASEETVGEDASFPMADDDDDVAQAAEEAHVDLRNDDGRPSGSSSVAQAEGDSQIDASKGGSSRALPRGDGPQAPSTGRKGCKSTGADNTMETTSHDDDEGSLVAASSSTATVISSDGSAFASPSPSGRASVGSPALTNRKTRSSSAKRKRREIETNKKSPSKSKDPEPEICRLDPPPPFSGVKPILQKAGFDFASGGFARPTGESFGSEDDFRRDLCEHGLDDYAGWTEREREKVADWVRFTHVNVGTSRDYELLDLSTYEEYRERLGIRYEDGYYVLPNGHRVDTELDLRVYLSRFGLPAECDVDALNAAERLSFAMFVAESHKPFERKAIHTPGKKRRSRLSLDTYSPQIQRSPAKADGGTESKKRVVLSRAAESAARDRRQADPSAPSRVNFVEPVGPTVAGFDVDSPSPRIAISPLARRSPNQMSMKSRREILLACKDLPTKSSDIVFPPDSSFEESVKKVESFVKCVIASEGGHGSSEDMPASLYVCGAPGLGKTAAVRACCDRLALERHEDVRTPHVCYVNASSMDASPQPDAVVLQRIGETLDISFSKSPQIKTIKSRLTARNAQILLIVDEIDILLSDTDDASSAVKSKQEEALEMLADWAGDPDLSIGFIGISNRKGNTKYERLKQLGKFEDVVDFHPYTQSDITYIVDALVGPSVIHEQALQLIGAKTEQIRSGDIRFAFEMVSKAASLCMESLSETELNGTPDPSMALIKMPAVYKVFKEENDRIKTSINELPITGKALLVVLATLAEKEAQYAAVQMLKNFACSVGIKQGEVMSAENFCVMLSTLCDNGLVDVGGKELSSLTLSDISHFQVRLGQSLDEVNAVVNDLCKIPALAEVREKVRLHRSTFKEQNHENSSRGKK